MTDKIYPNMLKENGFTYIVTIENDGKRKMIAAFDDITLAEYCAAYFMNGSENAKVEEL